MHRRYSLIFIDAAKIIRERGVKGEVLAAPLSISATLISPDLTVRIVLPNNSQVFKRIVGIRQHGGSFIIAFAGIGTPEEARELRNSIVQVESSALPSLKEDEYYFDDIIGLAVIAPDGNILGKVTDIIETGSNDVYCVRGSGREYLIPAIKDAIESIDIKSGTLRLRPMKGLLD